MHSELPGHASEHYVRSKRGILILGIIADTAPDPMHPYQYPIPPSGHSHIPHEASMRRDSIGSGNFLHANGPIGGGQGQPSTPQQLAQRSLDAGHGTDQNDADSSLRKRSKVSRACDECRRKKVYIPPGIYGSRLYDDARLTS